jgi:outer membrane protein assembly factor BamB
MTARTFALIGALSWSLVGPSFGQMSARVGDWPQWRGLNRDGVSRETGLLRAWPAGGPKLAWSIRGIGVGYAGPALAGEHLYVLGDLPEGCHVLALDRASGQTVWKSRIGEAGGNNSYPGPRATPTIDGNRLITMNQHGDVVCLELPGGQVLWRKNLERELGAVRPMWHFGEAPLVDGDRVICTPGGGRGSLVALDKQTGEVRWRCQAVTNAAAYCSVIVAEVAGTRQYIQMTPPSVFGVEAVSGALLWNAPRAGARAIVPTPVYAEGLVYVTSGYGVGCNAFRIEKQDDRFAATEVYAGKSIASHHGGVVKVGSSIFGYSDSGGWTGQDFKTGRILWQDRGVGKGSVVCADGLLYCRSEDGPMALVEAVPTGYRETGRFSQPDRSNKKAWPHPVVAGGRLYLRDQDLLLAYDVAERK